MKIKTKTPFTIIIYTSTALVTYLRPQWLPELLVSWLADYRDKQVSNSWLPYYLYCVIALSSIISMAKFRNRRLPILEDSYEFVVSQLVKSGCKILGVLIAVSIFVWLSEGLNAAIVGAVLGGYLLLFTLTPIWFSESLLAMASKNESAVLMPRGYKVMFYFSSWFSLLISLYGIIYQALLAN